MKNLAFKRLNRTASFAFLWPVFLIGVAVITHSVAGNYALSAAEVSTAPSVTSKSCGNCGRQVDLGSQVGRDCPFCGAHWSALDTRIGSSEDQTQARTAARNQAVPHHRKEESRRLKLSSRVRWPLYAHALYGMQGVVFHNHTASGVWLGLRSAASGCDLWIPANDMGQLYLPVGTFNVYVFKYGEARGPYEAGTISIGNSQIGNRVSTYCLLDDSD